MPAPSTVSLGLTCQTLNPSLQEVLVVDFVQGFLPTLHFSPLACPMIFLAGAGSSMSAGTAASKEHKGGLVFGLGMWREWDLKPLALTGRQEVKLQIKLV